MTTIRRANPTDAGPLAALAERTFRETFAGENSQPDMDIHCAKNFSTQIQLRELSDPLRITLLAEHEASPIGFAQLLLHSPARALEAARPCELNRLYVLGAWHGRRVAHELMHAVLSTAAASACDQLWLGVWERNPRAVAFYRKFGFKVIGEHSFVLGTDPQRDLLMAVAVQASRSTA